MEVLGYIASLFIGVSLGLVGAGGSILTVPVMVYFFHVPVLAATSYSLFVVGITSLMGTCYQAKQENVNGKVAILFSLASLAVVFVIRNYVMAHIPPKLFEVSGVSVTSSLVSMLLFSVLMVAAAFSMIRSKGPEATQASSKLAFLRLLVCGISVGVVTGFLGAGGGFILIPSLVLLLGLPMKNAIGTSLLVIAMNSLFGFALDINHLSIDWRLLVLVTGIASGGIFLGMKVGRNISSNKLKVSFGWMVMLMGILILVKELTGFVTKF